MVNVSCGMFSEMRKLVPRIEFLPIGRDATTMLLRPSYEVHYGDLCHPATQHEKKRRNNRSA